MVESKVYEGQEDDECKCGPIGRFGHLRDCPLEYSNRKSREAEKENKMSEEKKIDPPIMKFFEFGHLPEHLQRVSEPACAVAKHMNEILPSCAEKHAGLRKLLEAKDCFVRASMEK